MSSLAAPELNPLAPADPRRGSRLDKVDRRANRALKWLALGGGALVFLVLQAVALARSIVHFGALVPYALGEIPERFRAFLETRKPGVDPASVVASGIPAIADLVNRFVDVGFSKFVLVPVFPAEDLRGELEQIAKEVLPLQT